MRHAVLAFCLIANPLWAQAPEMGRWSSGPTEFSDNSAWVHAFSDGQLLEAGALCAADVPYFYLNLPNSVWSSADNHIGIMRLSVDGQAFEGEARFDPFEAEPNWTIRLTEDAIISLAAGNRLNATVVDLATVTFGLGGSGTALADALDGCGDGRGQNAHWDTYFTLLGPDETGTLRPVPSHAGIHNVSTGLDNDHSESGTSGAMRASIDARTQAACKGALILRDGAIKQFQIDDDDLPDLILDWGLVDCADPSIGLGAGACGMHMCSQDIYLSSVWQIDDWPKTILAIGVTPGDRVDRIALRSTRMGGTCPFSEICETEWRWTGSDIKAIR